MTPPVVPLLAASSDVTAILGTSPIRAFPMVVPQGQAMPAVTWDVVGGYPDNLLEGNPPPSDHVRITITCWAMDFVAVSDLSDKVRAALEPNGYLVSFNPADYDPETKRYSDSFDWSMIVEHA